LVLLLKRSSLGVVAAAGDMWLEGEVTMMKGMTKSPRSQRGGGGGDLQHCC
jgi:hypothetical protein